MTKPYTFVNPSKKQIDDYYYAQWETPYRSTVIFCDWLKKYVQFNNGLNILDMGAGMGSNVYHMAKMFDGDNFSGLDLNEELINNGNEIIKEKKIRNASLIQGDWFDLPEKMVNAYDGIVHFQTLMLFEDYKSPLDYLIKLNPDWIAFTSLLYEGNIECISRIRDFESEEYREFNYSVFSLPILQQYFNDNGYKFTKSQPFEIDIDLPKPQEWKGMQTYTERLIDGSRIQLSGPVKMPWYFFIASKNDF